MHMIRLADLVLLVLDVQGSPMQQFEDSLALMREYRIIPLAMKDDVDDDNPRLIFKRMQLIVNKVDDDARDEDAPDAGLGPQPFRDQFLGDQNLSQPGDYESQEQ